MHNAQSVACQSFVNAEDRLESYSVQVHPVNAEDSLESYSRQVLLTLILSN